MKKIISLMTVLTAISGAYAVGSNEPATETEYLVTLEEGKSQKIKQGINGTEGNATSDEIKSLLAPTETETRKFNIVVNGRVTNEFTVDLTGNGTNTFMTQTEGIKDDNETVTALGKLIFTGTGNVILDGTIKTIEIGKLEDNDTESTAKVTLPKPTDPNANWPNLSGVNITVVKGATLNIGKETEVPGD